MTKVMQGASHGYFTRSFKLAKQCSLTNSNCEKLDSKSANMASAVFNDFIRIEPFSGESGNSAKSWFEDFELLCQHKGMNDAQKLATLPLLLKGPAKAWFRTLKEDSRDSLDNIRRAFTAMYGNDSASRYTRIRDFYSRKQGNSEATRNYITFMMESAIMLNLTELQGVQAIIGGLLPNIQVQVAKDAPETYEALIKASTAAETTIPKDDTTTSLAQSVAALAEQIQQLSTRQESLIAAAVVHDSPHHEEHRGRSKERHVRFQNEPRDRTASRDRYERSNPRSRTPERSRSHYQHPAAHRPSPNSRYTSGRDIPDAGYRANTYNDQRDFTDRCHRCLSRNHRGNSASCWAYNVVCRACGRRGHAQVACRSAQRSGGGPSHINPSQ